MVNYRWAILAILLSAQATDGIGRQGLFALTPFFREDLGLTNAQVGLLSTAFSLASILTVVAIGWLADRVGARWMLFFGMAASGGFLAAVSRAYVFELAWVVLFLAGIGHAFIAPTATRAVMYWFPPRLRGLAMGIKQMGQPLGGAIAAATLPTLALLLGWRWAIAIAGSIAVLAGFMAWVAYREAPASTPPPSAPRMVRKGPLAILLNRNFLILSGMAVAFAMVNTAFTTYLVLFLKDGLNYSVTVAGLFFSLAQVAGASGRPLWGIVSDKAFAGKRKPVLCVIGFVGTVVLSTMALAAPDWPTWWVLLVVTLSAATMIAWSGVWLVLVGEIAGKESAGQAAGVAILMGNIGFLLGPPIFGLLVDHSGSYSLAWRILALLSFAGALVILLGFRETSYQSRGDQEQLSRLGS